MPPFSLGAPAAMAVSTDVGSVMLPKGVNAAGTHDNFERLAATFGTLRALGVKRGQILRTFLAEGALFGVVGSVALSIGLVVLVRRSLAGMASVRRAGLGLRGLGPDNGPPGPLQAAQAGRSARKEGGGVRVQLDPAELI